MRICKALELASKSITPLDARILLENTLNKSLSYIIANPNNELSMEEEGMFFSFVAKRNEGFPVAYITNKKEFYGRDFYVNENTLVPRCDTEILVEKALSLVENNSKVLDLCTGTGIIGLSMKAENPSLEVTLSDISSKALDVANTNKVNLILDADIIESDLFSQLDETYDMIVTNPPYVEPSFLDDCQIELTKEPKIALNGISNDGLLIIEKIIKDAKDHLNGYILIEASDHQCDKILKMLVDNGYTDINYAKDLANQRRVSYGRYIRKTNK